MRRFFEVIKNTNYDDLIKELSIVFDNADESSLKKRFKENIMDSKVKLNDNLIVLQEGLSITGEYVFVRKRTHTVIDVFYAKYGEKYESFHSYEDFSYITHTIKCFDLIELPFPELLGMYYFEPNQLLGTDAKNIAYILSKKHNLRYDWQRKNA